MKPLTETGRASKEGRAEGCRKAELIFKEFKVKSPETGNSNGKL